MRRGARWRPVVPIPPNLRPSRRDQLRKKHTKQDAEDLRCAGGQSHPAALGRGHQRIITGTGSAGEAPWSQGVLHEAGPPRAVRVRGATAVGHPGRLQSRLQDGAVPAHPFHRARRPRQSIHPSQVSSAASASAALGLRSLMLMPPRTLRLQVMERGGLLECRVGWSPRRLENCDGCERLFPRRVA
eukprot:scaffold4313_cov51-Phaeocystis_antarctica.AAC.1